MRGNFEVATVLKGESILSFNALFNFVTSIFLAIFILRKDNPKV